MELHLSQLVLLGAVALTAFWTDITRKKIYNWLTLPGIGAGLALQAALGGWPAVQTGLLGFAVGFGIFLLFFLMDAGMGGGDVKLIGAIGAITGPQFVIYTMFYGGLVGLAIGLTTLIWKGRVGYALGHFGRFLYAAVHPGREAVSLRNEATLYVPYGAALSVGALWQVLMAGLG